MSSNEELLLLSATASAATISLVAFIVKEKESVLNDYGCVPCSNSAIKEGHIQHAYGYITVRQLAQ